MTEIIKQLWISGTYFLQNIENFLEPILKNLNPSLFQNIILGVLAIFIPFAIVFLNDILNSKQEKRSEFEKMVLSDEVLGTKKIFWLALTGIVFFAFFSGKDISLFAKVISIFAALILIFLFWTPFKKILKFSEGYKSEFEIPFLKKLSLSTILWFKNKRKAEKLFRAWNSFWSEKSEFNEIDFIKIFISHIDDAIKYRKLELAIQLSQTYVNNIEKRDSFLIGFEILPKVFKWNKILNEQEFWLEKYDTEKRIQNLISQKHFPTFKNWILKLYNKINPKKDRFWNWHYFRGEFFQAIIKVLLKNGHCPYQLFSSFKKYVEESEKKLDKIKDEKEKKKYWNYITNLFTSFCPTFFNGIDTAPSNDSIWEHNFPAEWKIAIANKNNRISHVILQEFLQWSRDRIFKKDDKDNFDKNLTEVINGIFPNVHSSLFKVFLMLFPSSEIKDILEEKPNFYILRRVGRSSWLFVEESEEDQKKRFTKMMKSEEISEKEETIQIILEYFDWPLLDLNEEESASRKNYTEEQWQVIEKRVRKDKLQKIKTEIESNEIKEICKDSERKELYRKNFLELVELLLLEIEK